MLYVFVGTDREKARAAMSADIKKRAEGVTPIRVSDANTLADLQAAIGGGGMFDTGTRAVVLDSVLDHEEMQGVVMTSLKSLQDSKDFFYLFATKVDAATKRSLEKYAESIQKFDAAKAPQDNAIFTLKGALAKGDKKALWLGIVREIIEGKAPEMVHGFLFWAAKDMALRAPSARAKKLLAELAELPHEARRRGEELEYALERFVLTRV